MRESTKDRCCLTVAEIKAYLERDSEPRHLAEMESHVDACRLCTDAVQGAQGWADLARFRTTVESLNAQLRTRARKGRVSSSTVTWRQYLAVAAALVLGVGAAVTLFRTPAHEALFRGEFEPYPSTIPVVRGEAPRSALAEALQEYEAGNYEAALRELEKHPDDPAALFYYSISKLSLGKPGEAASGFEKVIALGQTDFSSPARWYLALSYLRMNERDKARGTLEEIAGSRDFYRDRAHALLRKL